MGTPAIWPLPRNHRRPLLSSHMQEWVGVWAREEKLKGFGGVGEMMTGQLPQMINVVFVVGPKTK